MKISELKLTRPKLDRAFRKPAAAVLLATLATGIGAELSSGTAEATQYATVPAERGTIDVRVEAKGVVQPRDTVRVIAPDAGTVTWTGAEPGTRVRRGQPLARVAST